MTVKKLATMPEKIILDATKTLLIVGPQPPPMGGATATVQVFLTELSKHTSIQTSLVNTRLSDNYRKKKVLLELETVQRAVFILRQYLEKIGSCDAVLVFGNNPFILTLVPILFVLARLYHKPFYLKPVGGDLDLYLASQNKFLRSYLVKVLSKMDGILPQTQQLQTKLSKFGCDNISYVPGCRTFRQLEPAPAKNSEGFGLIFFSQIKREKGPLTLLEALQLIDREDDIKISCDFYGPVFEEIEQEFWIKLEQTPGAEYCGVAKIGTGSNIIKAYDALVLPTYFKSEGHPGVIIEAMQAGVPVISTNHRAIPELITDGENGLLVPKQDSRALADAIKRIALDPPLRQRMGLSSYKKGQEFRANVVVPQLLQVIFPE